MSDDYITRCMPISYSEAMLSFSALMTFMAYLYKAHIGEDECGECDWKRMRNIKDQLRTYITQHRDADTPVARSLSLSKSDASQLLFAVCACYEKMRGDPSGLHTLLEIDDPELLVALAGRIKSFIQSFPSVT